MKCSSLIICSLFVLSACGSDDVFDGGEGSAPSRHSSQTPGTATGSDSSRGAQDTHEDGSRSGAKGGDDHSDGLKSSSSDEDNGPPPRSPTGPAAPGLDPQRMHIAMFTNYLEPVWRNQFMLTGTAGRLSCLAVKDTNVLPAGAGFQYLIVPSSDGHTPGLSGRGYCPAGEYVIENHSYCHDLFDRDIPAYTWKAQGCATYRQWDERGTVAPLLPQARSGLVHVSKTSQGCVIDVELHFPDHSSLLGTYLIQDTSEEVSCGASL